MLVPVKVEFVSVLFMALSSVPRTLNHLFIKWTLSDDSGIGFFQIMFVLSNFSTVTQMIHLILSKSLSLNLNSRSLKFKSYAFNTFGTLYDVLILLFCVKAEQYYPTPFLVIIDWIIWYKKGAILLPCLILDLKRRVPKYPGLSRNFALVLEDLLEKAGRRGKKVN